ncbi:MAG TPA: PilZ domain-containing protein [Candidatus Sulfotelmatobacter sp.]|nr:PilZ domain-containing protein [Candidatus Sulfotelmatobacter sp.]
MNKAMASTLSPAAVAALTMSRRATARTALVGLKEPHRALLAECFRQFGIEPVSMTANAAERLAKEKFEACVLGLSDTAGALMEAARSSPSNSRCILYAVGGNAQEAMRFSKYGINAMFQEPLERTTALKVVRSTKMLVQHEFRRYVRIPVMTEVSVIGDGRRIVASSVEMSSGGMSVQSHEDFSIGVPVEISFSLMTMPRVIVRGQISWRKPKSFGVRFDATDDRRQPIKRWIDSYLEN